MGTQCGGTWGYHQDAQWGLGRYLCARPRGQRHLSLPVWVSGDDPTPGDWAVRWGDVGCSAVGCRAGRFGVWTVQRGVQGWEAWGPAAATKQQGETQSGQCLQRASLAPQSSQFKQRGPSRVPGCGGLGRGSPSQDAEVAAQQGQEPGVPSCLTPMVTQPQGDRASSGPWDPPPCAQPSPQPKSCSCPWRVSRTGASAIILVP